MGDDSSRLRDLYLDSMIRILTNTIYQDGNIQPQRDPAFDPSRREIGRDWPANALTMIGRKRLQNVRRLAEQVLIEEVPGDLIETGVWRGGACIMMRAVLRAYDDRVRKVICADSFQGLPPPDIERFPIDKGDRHHTITELAVSREEVASGFDRCGLLDEQVLFLEGFFRETLPTMRNRTFALIRLDGDMYESTIQALENLYPSLSVGGYLIVDDYGAIPACAKAVNDYRDSHAITEPLQTVDWTGRWWQKQYPSS
jgi:hypothetical protein